jgi:pilus assembly protein CpaF
VTRGSPVDDAQVDAVCAAVVDEPGDLEALVAAAVRRVAPLATPTERVVLARRATARLAGLAELDALVDDPTIDEVLVNQRDIWVDRGGRLTAAGELRSHTAVELLERILAPIGRRVDRTMPIVDARLPGGARVCAVLPPIAVDGPVVSIRRFADEVRPLADFTDTIGVDLCRELIAARCNVVVTGATSSGKTSLLASLLGEIGDDRVVVLEDTAELACPAAHTVRLEARPPAVEGPEPVDLARLVRTALRLRPDRIVVGEVRGDEVVALVQALNTGHDGSFSTCHANGPVDALLRLESLVVQAAPRWPLEAVRHQIARSLDVVVHVERAGHRRRIATVAEVGRPGAGGPVVRELASPGPDGRLVRRGPLERRRA